MLRVHWRPRSFFLSILRSTAHRLNVPAAGFSWPTGGERSSCPHGCLLSAYESHAVYSVGDEWTLVFIGVLARLARHGRPQGFEPLNGACLPFSQFQRQCYSYTQLDVQLSLWRLALLLPWSVAGLCFVLAWAVPLLFMTLAPLCTAFPYGECLRVLVAWY